MLNVCSQQPRKRISCRNNEDFCYVTLPYVGTLLLPYNICGLLFHLVPSGITASKTLRADGRNNTPYFTLSRTATHVLLSATLQAVFHVLGVSPQKTARRLRRCAFHQANSKVAAARAPATRQSDKYLKCVILSPPVASDSDKAACGITQK